MKALNKLTIFTIKGMFRNLVRNPGKLIMTLFIVIIFVGSFISSRMVGDFDRSQYTMVANLGNAYNLSLLMIIVMFVSTSQSRGRSLLFPNDAHYLLTGPFSRSQVIKFSLRTSIISILVYTLFSMYFFFTMSAGFPKTLAITFIALLGSSLVSIFTVLLSDYLFLLETGGKKKTISRIIVIALVTIVVAILAYAFFLNNQDFVSTIKYLGTANLLYYIPVIGQAKLIFTSFINQNYLVVILATLFLIILNIVIYLLIIRFNGNINEDLYEASLRYGELLKRNKKGKTSKEVKNYNTKIKTKFSSGAKSIFSKNILIARREKTLFEPRFIFILVLYLALAKFTFGNSMELYLIYDIIFLLVVAQNNTLLNDLQNYQIYLLPQSAFKKLFYVVLFPLLQLQVLNFISMILAAILLNADLVTAISYLIYTSSIALIVVGVSTLVTRITKSKTSQVVRMTAQMFLTILFIAPTAIGFVVVTVMELNFSLMLLCLIGGIINILLFLLLIFMSKNIFANVEIS